MKYNEENIYQAILEGDPMQVVDVLYEIEFPKLKSYILSNSGTKTEAKDIFQESLIKLIKYIKLGKFKNEYTIGAFLFAVGRNEWRSRGKKKNIHVDINDNESVLGSYEPEEIELEEKQTGVAIELLSQLGENCKSILTATIFYKTKLKILAEELGYENVDTLKTRAYKCKQRLIKLVKANPEFIDRLKNG